MEKPLHYWRIHAKVTRRLWSDIPLEVRNAIANDSAHITSQFNWFNNKVNEDTERLFQDGEYYYNQKPHHGLV